MGDRAKGEIEPLTGWETEQKASRELLFLWEIEYWASGAVLPVGESLNMRKKSIAWAKRNAASWAFILSSQSHRHTMRRNMWFLFLSKQDQCGSVQDAA
ncbi:hypothetical protein DQX05_10930 [Paenibacillus thiaminolyticus]|uniref:Uncharacterized protein n=1 Tax=Paenibacillus thiaminolyticus TaxID=49283 RepID=A0A3A3GKK7_PANTH|nr:hypothetical protein DQX05_10930 [Paenibacillus thiaminolyticus]